MADDRPPWARPRASSRPTLPDQPRATRRLGDVAPPPQTAAPDATGTTNAPPPGRRPPPVRTTAEQPDPSTPPAADPYVGVVAGPVDLMPGKLSRRPPGLIAVAGAAAVTMVAIAARSLFGDGGRAILIAGLVLPSLAVAAAAVAWLLDQRRGAGQVRRFTLRAGTAKSTAYELHDDAPREALRTGDIVRVLPGHGGSVRAVEVLASLSGPVVGYVARRPVVPPADWVGFGLAALLLTGTAAILFS